MVVNYLKNKGLIDKSDDWALFAIANSHGVGRFCAISLPAMALTAKTLERPLRHWEIVKDIVDPGSRVQKTRSL